MLTRKEFWTRHAAIWAQSDYSKAANDIASAAAYDLHHEYNIQFATDRTMRMVERTIGKERILASAWPFNDIPLHEWDSIDGRVKDTIDRKLLGAAEDCKSGTFLWSASTATSIAKACAAEIKKGTTTLGRS